MDVWAMGVGALPSVAHNGTGAEAHFAGITWQPGQLSIHPGSAGQYSHVRWTAPNAGKYQVLATFTGIDAAPTTTDVHIFQSGTQLLNGTVSAYQTGPMLSSTVTMAAGNTLDFSVGYGTGGYSCDTTGLAVVIISADLQITNITPTFGPTAGGTNVTITGYNLSGASSVRFGGVAATNVIVSSDTQITCTTPAHSSGFVDVSVTTPDGTGTLANGFFYDGSTWTAAAVISGRRSPTTSATFPA
jgi:hypothetical protein